MPMIHTIHRNFLVMMKLPLLLLELFSGPSHSARGEYWPHGIALVVEADHQIGSADVDRIHRNLLAMMKHPLLLLELFSGSSHSTLGDFWAHGIAIVVETDRQIGSADVD